MASIFRLRTQRSDAVNNVETGGEGTGGLEETQFTKSSPIMSLETALKLLYFTQAGATACMAKFMPLFFREKLGFSAAAIGTLLMISGFTKFLGSLFWGRFADRTGKYTTTMVWANVLSAAFVSSLSAPALNGVLPLLVILYIAHAFFQSGPMTLVDSLAVIAKSKGTLGSYGKIRLWASVGGGLFAMLSGLIVDLTDIHSIFVTFGLGVVVSSLIVTFCLEDPEKKDIERIGPATQVPLPINAPNADHSDFEVGFELIQDKKKMKPAPQGMLTVLCRFQVLLLLFNLLLQGMAAAFVDAYLYMYLTEVYEVPSAFLGTCTMTSAASGIPIFFYSDALLKKFGVVRLLTTAQVLYALRVFAYTLVPKEHYFFFLFIEPLHSFIFSSMWAAAVEYSRGLAPPELQGTMQALVRGIYLFLGHGLGAITGGLIIDAKGGGAEGFHLMYRVGGTVVLVWSLVWHVLMRVDERFCRQREDTDAPSKGFDVPLKELILQNPLSKDDPKIQSIDSDSETKQSDEYPLTFPQFTQTENGNSVTELLPKPASVKLSSNFFDPPDEAKTIAADEGKPKSPVEKYNATAPFTFPEFTQAEGGDSVTELLPKPKSVKLPSNFFDSPDDK
jgi:predicted MFS family arabinose efflux permease